MNDKDHAFFRSVLEPILNRYQNEPNQFSEKKFSLNHLALKIICPANSEISNISKALSHLQVDLSERESLTIFCVDALKSEFSLPFEPWKYREKLNKKEILYYTENGYFISRSPESSTLSILDMDLGVGLYWVKDYSRIPAFEKAAPFRSILQWWFELKKCHMVHSAAVGIGDQGVLIPGGGGQGKSTLSVNCLKSGMDFFGDDYVVICKNKGYSVSSIYNTAKLDQHSMKLLSFRRTECCGTMETGSREKDVIFLDEYFPHKIKFSIDLKYILLPKISDTRFSEIVKIRPSECFRSITPSTVFQHIGRSGEIVDFLFKLTNLVPCYKILIGKDFKSSPQKIKELIGEL